MIKHDRISHLGCPLESLDIDKDELKKTSSELFSEFYRTNYWGNEESLSGKGSTQESASFIVERLPWLIDRLGIKRMLDLPCGDMNYMQSVNLKGVNYIGGDIVADLIERNKTLFPGQEFLLLDAQYDAIPRVDLVLCRDLLIHLPNASIRLVMENILKSSSRYLLASHYLNDFGPIALNGDIQIGEFRAVNLTLPPFGLSAPILMLPEKQSSYKMLALYDLNDPHTWEVWDPS